MRPSALAATAVAALATVVLPAVPASAGGNSAVAEARAATAAFHNVEKARAAGYLIPEVADLDERECVPGMGYHFINPEYVTFDPADLDPAKPQVLLYEVRNGKLKLVGVEYVVFTTQPVAADQEQLDPEGPRLFGRMFHGVMAGHFEGMPNHWELHTWIWSHNDAGRFNQSNDRITC